jgi:hypothetical protein
MSAAALRALVTGLVDYAGLFPPAALDMPEAVAAYASYLDSDDAWALGRFIVPVARLDELAEAAGALVTQRTAPWRLSALLGENPVGDAAWISAFNTKHTGRFVVDVAEFRASSAEAIVRATRALDRWIIAYVELPVDQDPLRLLHGVKQARARAKIRTGGVTPEAFPSTAHVARFLTRCVEVGVPFKATAGLHHPLRAEYRLTYAPNAPRGTMFGFLNVFLAAAFALTGIGEATLARLLEERDPAAFRFTDDSAVWRGFPLTLGQLVEARASLGIGFGSCSFREPIDDLHQLGLL